MHGDALVGRVFSRGVDPAADLLAWRSALTIVDQLRRDRSRELLEPRGGITVEAAEKNGPILQQLGLHEIIVTRRPRDEIHVIHVRLYDQREALQTFQVASLDQLLLREPNLLWSLGRELAERDVRSFILIHSHFSTGDSLQACEGRERH